MSQAMMSVMGILRKKKLAGTLECFLKDLEFAEGIAPDGMTTTAPDGMTKTALDSMTTTAPDGKTTTALDGMTTTAPDDMTTTAPDGMTTTASDGIPDGMTTKAPDGMTTTASGGIPDGMTTTAPDGMTTTASDGIPDGMTTTAPDGMTATAPDGMTKTAPDGMTKTARDGMTTTAPDGMTTTASDGIPDGMSTTAPDGMTKTAPDGMTTTAPDGKTTTAPDGMTKTAPDGMTTTAPDGMTTTAPDGMTTTAPDGMTTTAPDGMTTTAPDGMTTTAPGGMTKTAPDGMTTTAPDGMTKTAPDGMTTTAPDGMTTTAPDGMTTTAPDGMTKTAPDGMTTTAPDGMTKTAPDGMTTTAPDGMTTTAPDGMTTTAPDGMTKTAPDGMTTTAPDGMTTTAPDGMTTTAPDGMTKTAPDGMTTTAPDGKTTTALDGMTTTAPDDMTTTAPDDMTTTASDGIADGMTTTAPDGMTTTASGGIPDGMTTTAPDGMTTTAPDGMTTTAPDGMTKTAPDGMTTTAPDGKTTTALDGMTTTAPDDMTTTAPDDMTTTASDGIADGMTTTAPDGMTTTASGGIPDGMTTTAPDGMTTTASGGIPDGMTTTAPEGMTTTASVGIPDGMFTTAPDGMTKTAPDGMTTTAPDGMTKTAPDGTTTTASDGIPDGMTTTAPDGMTKTAPDGMTTTAPDGMTTTAPDGMTTTARDGMTATAPDGMTTTASDGIPDGMTTTAPDGMTKTAPDGMTTTAPGGMTTTAPDGMTTTARDGMTATAPDGMTTTAPDGMTTTASDGIPDGMTTTAPDGMTTTAPDGMTKTAPDGMTTTAPDGMTTTAPDCMTTTALDGMTATAQDGMTITAQDGMTTPVPDTVRAADNCLPHSLDSLSTTTAYNIISAALDSITPTAPDSMITTAADVMTSFQDGMDTTAPDDITTHDALIPSWSQDNLDEVVNAVRYLETLSAEDKNTVEHDSVILVSECEDSESDCSDNIPPIGKTIIQHLKSDSNDFDDSDHDDDDHTSDDDSDDEMLFTSVKRVSSFDLKETKIERDVTYPDIYIRKHLKNRVSVSGQSYKKKNDRVYNNYHDRVYNNYHCCFVCAKMVQHIPVHMKTHKTNPVVAEELAKIKPDFSKLRLMGDDKNNRKVVQSKQGEFVVSRRTSGRLDISMYGPCILCREWMLLSGLKKHFNQRCGKNKSPCRKKNIILKSRILAGHITGSASELIKNEVFKSMKLDHIGKVAQRDKLILALGESWLRRSLDNVAKRRYYTSEHMRLCARLHIALNNEVNSEEKDDNESDKEMHENDGDTQTMWDLLVPQNFDQIVNAALKCSLPVMDDLEDLKSPSNAIKLKYDIRRLVSAKYAYLLKEDIPEKGELKKCKRFMKLMEIEWSERVTKVARTVLQKRQLEMRKELPAPGDVEKLTRYLRQRLTEIELEPENFREIVKLCEARLLVYNKRRSGELEVVSLQNYASRRNDLSDLDESVADDLTVVEQQLLKNQELMTVRGKGGRPVPIIIPPEAVSPLSYIASSHVREAAGVPPGNNYLFPNSVDRYVRVYQTLQSFCNKLQLKAPGRITSVALRKYTATVSQMMNLDKYQMDWVCKHLGHTKSVHREAYRQMSGLVERVYIAKLMLVQDNNLSGKYKGADLHKIDVKGYQDSTTGTNTSTPPDDHKTEVKVSSTPPSAEKYIPPHQKNLGSSPGSAGSSLSNHNTSSQSSFSRQNSNFGSKTSAYTSRSPASKTKEPVNDFFPFDNVSVYPLSPSSPVKSPTKAVGYCGTSPRSRPQLNMPQSNINQPPFYPPEQIGDSAGEYAEPNTWNLTPPQAFEQTHPPYGLNPPAFYQSHIPPPPLNHSVQFYSQSMPPVSPIKQPGNSDILRSSPVKVPHRSEFDTRRNQQMGINSHYHDTYYKPENRQGQEAVQNARSAGNNGHYYSNHNNSSVHNGERPRIKLQMPTTPSKYYGYEPPKMSPESPESPAIAAFNLGDLEHTQMTSTDHFHKQLHQERLQALHEEAEDIARESKEQSELVHYSRYAGSRDQYVETEAEDCMPAIHDLDVYDQIAQEIHTSVHSNKEPEELKKSPIKKSGKVKECSNVTKLEGIPQSYIADINFTEAVKEALESGKTSGMDNARALLDGIVESLKMANVEKQLYDVLLLMLAKAVKEYNLYHTVVMDTINTLNGELEIKECLAKALKRQQELCVRVPTPKQPQHIDYSRVMAHVYNMALSWSDSNASIQDGILHTVEKWIVFNNKGSQIGQVDKENVFLDCFGAFWEVSGTQLIQHNQAFRSRIKDEVRKKLLNENVSRSIRERLLDVMLDLFSLNTEKHDVSTQTQRRTMIPSSCQIRPSTCDKATFMELEWQDEGFRNLDGLSQMNWQVSTDYASPDLALSLRPLGRGGPSQTLSTPKDSFYSTKSSDTLDTSNVHDLSKVSNITDSVYVTPSESYVADTDLDKPDLNDLRNGVNEVSPTSERSAESSRKNLLNRLEADIGQGSNEAYAADGKPKDTEYGKDVQTRNVNKNNNSKRTVAEQKSAIGKSLVDWFDYEAPAVENARNGAKLEEKRLETRKKLDSTSMELIENDVALKYAPAKDLSKKKSKKDNNRDKKGEKTNMVLDERKQDSNKSIEPCKFESELQQVIIDSLQYCGKGDVTTARDVDNGVENIVDENIDWWAVGEGVDTRYFGRGAEETIGDNFYIDNGPDVIIEDEFEEDVNDMENVEIKKDNETNSEASGAKDSQNLENIVNEKLEKISKCSSDSSEDEIGRCNVMVEQKHDNFAFDIDNDNDENWDSASSDDPNVNDWVGLQYDNSGYEKEFPETDLKTVLPPTHDIYVEPAENSSDRNYENDFPTSNLADFIKVTDEQEIEERPRAARWVPGRRKCMNCYSEDHTTESCKQFVILQ